MIIKVMSNAEVVHIADVLFTSVKSVTKEQIEGHPVGEYVGQQYNEIDGNIQFMLNKGETKVKLIAYKTADSEDVKYLYFTGPGYLMSNSGQTMDVIK